MSPDPAGPGPDAPTSAELTELVLRLGQPRVLVVGDLMLDRYVWGDAERISQEAPVVLLHADRREERLGGASSVATLLQALGARTSLVGIVGSDADGLQVRQILSRLGIDAEGVELIGHHEVLLPLLHAAVASKLAATMVPTLAA